MYNDCAAKIIETVDGEDGNWYYIESGSVTGYIKSKYFLTGEDAEQRAAEIGKIFGRINVGGLRLRTEPSVESDIITSLWEGEIYSVLDDDFDFTKITLGKDDEGNEVAGYVKSEYIDVYVDFDTAISLEEEAARIAEEERLAREAREAEERLEAERLERERQAAEQAERDRQAAEQAERDRQAAAQAERDRQAAAQQQTPAPAPTPAPEPAPAPAPANNISTATRDAVVAYAKQFIGNPYVWGGTSLTNGCDCSGFVMGVYKKFGISLPHSSRAQANCGTRVSIANLRPGDLVFYANGSTIYHVAMYIGNGQIVHAINEKRGIGITSMNFSSPYCAITLLG
ncbi:MAG: C40 family peptidase [Lachnospiraceae bacterium]|nr:C40 family peptidase [Lachnospiraceae bacterium]